MAKTLFTLENAKTVWVDDNPFNVPGTDLVITKVKIENSDGDRELYSTMSKQIATDGFTGDIEVYENDKGKVYIRKAPKAEQNSGGQSDTPKQTDEYWEDKNSAIKAQWAIGQAVQLQVPQGLKMPHYDEIEVSAKLLFAMVDRVKAPNMGSSESTNPKALLAKPEVGQTTTPQTATQGNTTSGYDKFKANKPTLKQGKPDGDAESESLYASIATSESEESDE